MEHNAYFSYDNLLYCWRCESFQANAVVLLTADKKKVTRMVKLLQGVNYYCWLVVISAYHTNGTAIVYNC